MASDKIFDDISKLIENWLDRADNRIDQMYYRQAMSMRATDPDEVLQHELQGSLYQQEARTLQNVARELDNLASGL